MRNKEKKLLSEIELLIAENKSVKRNDVFGSIDIDESEKTLTEILESEAQAFVMAAIASGLLSSMAITPFAFGKSRSTSRIPSTIPSLLVRISWSSQVM